jgi:PAS domain S-box-containing protein
VKKATPLEQQVEQRTAQLAAANAELQLQVELLQHLPVSAWTLKPDGTPDFVNQVWLEYSGQSLDFVRSHPEAWMTAVHPEDREIAAKSFWEGVHSGKGFGFETRSFRAMDGTYRWHFQQAVVLRDAEGKVLKFVGTTTDIDDQKRAEEQLRRIEAELAHESRVASLGVLTESIVHELHQPLTGIINNAATCLRMLSTEPPNVEGACVTARRGIRDANRAAEVTARLHELFAKREPTTEPVDLNEVTHEVLALAVSRLQRDKVILRQELADDLPLIAGDRVQLQQVVLNLVLNASEAMSGVEDRARDLLIRTERAGTGVRMTVQDAGTGIQPEAVADLFDPFHTTMRRGMGIGLSVCRSILESHRGRIWAVLHDGPGATFSFSIPGPEGNTLPSSSR